MQFFNFDETKTPTKLFVTQLCEPEVKQPTVVAKGIGLPSLSNVLITIAPELIDKGAEAISKVIGSFAKDHVTTTLVQKNIDARTANKIFLPDTLTLVRGNFASDLSDTQEGEIFGDGVEREQNQVKLISDKELHIEIDIVASHNNDAIYFQPKFYYYQGEDVEGNNVDEIALAFAFIPAGESISSYEKLTYQSILHFKQLEDNQPYYFQSKSGYDTSYQSPWIIPHLSRSGPYTLVVGIQEIRKGNSFAKLVQELYEKHDEELSNEVKAQVLKALESQKD